jgi:hypothetical protein
LLVAHETVALRFETVADGVWPVGIETAFAVGVPAPLPVQDASAAAAGAAAAIASARMIGRGKGTPKHHLRR